MEGLFTSLTSALDGAPLVALSAALAWGFLSIVLSQVLMGVIPLPLPDPARVGLQRRGAWAALVLGLVFGLALGPCTFAFMAPMLAVTFRVAATSTVFGVLLLTAYGVGHCVLIVVAGTSTAWAQRVLDWNAASTTGRWIKRVCGLLVVLGGFYLLHIAH